MAAERALALVVRGTDWSETSRITTLFTREFGRVRALAKGGRRLKSNFDCAFDLLTVCRVLSKTEGTKRAVYSTWRPPEFGRGETRSSVVQDGEERVVRDRRG